jgi:hypothetical protein
MSMDISVSKVTGYNLDDRDLSPNRTNFFVAPTMSQSAVGPTQPIQLVKGALSRG